MKVLHINDHLAWKGGVEVYLLGLLPLLEEQQVHGVVAHGHPAEIDHAHAVHEPCISDPLFPKEKARGRIQALLEKVNPDLVHLHSVQNWAVIQSCLEKVPVIMTGHDYRPICPASNLYYRRTRKLCSRSPGWGCLAVTLRHRCMTPRPVPGLSYLKRTRSHVRNAGRYAKVILPSGYARTRYIQAGFPESSCTVLPYFCPLAPLDQPRPAPKHPRITFLGRANSSKGLDVFIKVLARQDEEVRGVMVGGFSDADRQRLLSLGEQEGCAGRLEIVPWAGRDSIPALLAETTVLVFPTMMGETLGIVGLEAMAHGVPVLASDMAAFHEWLEDGVNGLAFPPGDAETAAVKLKALLKDPGRMHGMGKQGIERVRNGFLPGQHVSSLLEIYRDVLAARDG